MTLQISILMTTLQEFDRQVQQRKNENNLFKRIVFSFVLNKKKIIMLFIINIRITLLTK